MKEKVYDPSCGRENDLVAFLYGELDPRESTVFRSHLQECRSCAAELAGFSDVRESVVAWRNEALGGVTSPAASALPAQRSGVVKPSALTALREFFNLSPLWMKGAIVFGSLLFCLLVVLAAARLRETPQAPLANKPSAKSFSEQELNAAIELRVQEEIQRIKNSQKPTPSPEGVVGRGANPVSHKRATYSVTAANGHQKARRPLSRVEREQLAADLRLIDNPAEGDIDLLDDRINQ